MNNLKETVRAFISAEGWSVNRLAAAAGLTTSTLSKLLHPDWNPTANTLEACLDVVDRHRSATEFIFDVPISNPLPMALLRRENNRMFQQCVEIWKDEGARFGDMFIHRLERIGAAARLSAVQVGSDNRMRMISYGPNAFGAAFDAHGKLLSEMPDRELFGWIESRLWRVLATEEPEFSSCVAPTETIIGQYDVPYTTLVLPCMSGDDGILDSAVTISRLEPSPYRDKIRLIASNAKVQAA